MFLAASERRWTGFALQRSRARAYHHGTRSTWHASEQGCENPDAPDLRLLRDRREWPSRCAADERDELASAHSKTSSARPDRGSGTVMPSALAVFRLIYNSTLVACWTGRSPGFSPLRTRPA